MGVPVSEGLPQSVATEGGSSMQFAGNLPGFIFVFQQSNLKESVFWGWRVDGQSAESIHVGL